MEIRFILTGLSFLDEKELKKEMDTNAHMFLPAYGREEIEVYQENFRFILVAYNPGSALLVNKVSSESITKSITKLAFKIWPVILVVLLMGSITGTLLWMAVNFITVSLPSLLFYKSYSKRACLTKERPHF